MKLPSGYEYEVYKEHHYVGIPEFLKNPKQFWSQAF
jgi:hypothetical protein